MLEGARRGLRVARGLCAPSADILLREDPRPSILYLRPFGLDEKALPCLDLEEWGLELGVREEEIIVQVFGAHGPVVALGDPRQRRSLLGAARFASPGGDWRQVVAEYALRAQLIILSGGITSGIVQEIRIARAVEPRRVLLHVSDDLARNYGMFYRQVQDLMPGLLPEDVGASRWIWFDEDWRAHPLPGPSRPPPPGLARQCAAAALDVVRPLLCVPETPVVRTLRRLRRERWVIAGSVVGCLAGAFVLRAQAVAPGDDLLGFRTARWMLERKAEVVVSGLRHGSWADAPAPRPTRAILTERRPTVSLTTIFFNGLRARSSQLPQSLAGAAFSGWKLWELRESESRALHLITGSTYASPVAEYPRDARLWLESGPVGAIQFVTPVTEVRLTYLAREGRTEAAGISAFGADGEWLALDVDFTPKACCSRWQAWDTVTVSTQGNGIHHVHVWGQIYVFNVRFSKSHAADSGEIAPRPPLEPENLLDFSPHLPLPTRCRMEHRFSLPSSNPG